MMFVPPMRKRARFAWRFALQFSRATLCTQGVNPKAFGSGFATGGSGMQAIIGLSFLPKPGWGPPGTTGVPEAMFSRIERMKGALFTSLKKVV